MVKLVVDSGCDLPDTLFRKYSIPILPHSISFGEDTFADQRNPAKMNHFYSMSLADRSRRINSGPPAIQDISIILWRLIESGHKDIVIQTINGTNSPTYENACTVARKLMHSDAIKGDVQIHAVDSKNLFSGQGLLALYSLIQILRGLNGAEVAAKATEFARWIHSYATIKDVYYVRERARIKNEKSINWFKATAAYHLDLHPILSMHHDGSSVTDTVRGFDNCTEAVFRLAIDKIRAGKLITPMIVISIAGRLEDLPKAQGFTELEKVAEEHKVKIYRSVMSLSGGINLGPGTVGLSLASKE
ncbi:DegV family protein [Microbulbifer thermotolerans]|uniref:DegV family protein n=1 Tax=Microbulbifer thermotolerans TaxID=252514 RepID=A0AB35HZQ1_MICTH|nr:DegV family protein [Microbulbifer thermotolerans]MCX2802339.1 DegV family protein [Microbulbifer thermotolerans]